MDAVGFAVLRERAGDDARRYIVFPGGRMEAEWDMSQEALDAVGERLPFVDAERRASLFPTALAMQLRTCVEKQELEIAHLRSGVHEENKILRAAVLRDKLDTDDHGTTAALIDENLALRARLRALQEEQNDEPFRDRLDRERVAAIQGSLLRMTGAIWSFAPVAQQLGEHNDPHVRKAYETNLSLMTMMQENCEAALQNCVDLY
jgi:hypothetical protein